MAIDNGTMHVSSNERSRSFRTLFALSFRTIRKKAEA